MKGVGGVVTHEHKEVDGRYQVLPITTAQPARHAQLQR